MTKFMLFVLLLSGSAVSVQAGEPLALQSTAREITIFKSGAQVTRTASAALPAGRSELVFKGLSTTIKENTIQVKAADAVTIMSVSFGINYLDELSKQADIQKLEAQLEPIPEKIARLRDALKVYQQEESLLSKNAVQVIGVPNNPLKTEDLRALADFQRSRLTEVVGKEHDLDLQIKELETQADKIRKQLAALNAQKTNPSGEITVVVTTASKVNASFTFNYFVPNAGWEPVYDVRVKDVASPVNLFQKAHLYQQSGESWQDIKLSLSTGDPTENNNRPQLNPWLLRYVSPYARSRTQSAPGRYEITGSASYGTVQGRIFGDDGEALVGASVTAVGTSTGVRTDVNGNFNFVLPAGVSRLAISYTGYRTLEIPVNMNGLVMEITLGSDNVLSEVVVTGLAVSRKKRNENKDEEADAAPPLSIVELPTTYLYEIEAPVTLLSGGKPQTVDIKTYELPASYQYTCVPKMDPSAFLTARVTGWETLGLLSGEANLFFEGTFLGKSRLEFISTNDTLILSLGRDKNISITRTKMKEYSKRRFLSDKKEDSRSFELAIKNKKPQPIELVLEDQIPVSTQKGISVDLNESSSATQDAERGILRWTLELKPAEDRKLRFGYTVKYPKDKLIALE